MSDAFCLDTSAFIDAWERYYSRDVFPSLWEKMDGLMVAGTVVASIEVYKEMEKKSDGVITWAAPHKRLFVDSDDEVLASVSQIMKDFPAGFVDPRRARSGADPFVIAVARLRGAAVVTAEKPGKKREIKIPDVCRHYDIPCFAILEMFRRLRVAF